MHADVHSHQRNGIDPTHAMFGRALHRVWRRKYLSTRSCLSCREPREAAGARPASGHGRQLQRKVRARQCRCAAHSLRLTLYHREHVVIGSAEARIPLRSPLVPLLRLQRTRASARALDAALSGSAHAATSRRTYVCTYAGWSITVACVALLERGVACGTSPCRPDWKAAFER